MDNKLKVKLTNGNYLVTEVYDNGDGFPKEIFTHIEDKNGVILQDICLVRQHYDIPKNTCDVVTTEDVDCIVWGESDNEDYTDKFVICQYEFEED